MRFKPYPIVAAVLATLLIASIPATAQQQKPDYVRAFEQDLYSSGSGKTFKNSVMPRIDPSDYGEWSLEWHNRIGSNACMVYLAPDSVRNGKTREANLNNIAISMKRKEGAWVVRAYNIMPGENVSAYNRWLEVHGCRES